MVAAAIRRSDLQYAGPHHDKAAYGMRLPDPETDLWKQLLLPADQTRFSRRREATPKGADEVKG